LIKSVSFSPNGKYFFFNTNRSTIKLFQTNTGNEIWCRKPNKGMIEQSHRDPVFTPDGKHIFIIYGYFDMNNRTGNDKSVLIDTKTGKIAKNLNFPFLDNLDNIEFNVSPDGKSVFGFVNKNGKYENLKQWSLETGNLIKTFPITNDKVKYKEILISPDGKYAMIVEKNPLSIQIWDINNVKKIKNISSSANSFDVISSPNSIFLKGNKNYDKSLKTFDFKQGKITEKKLLQESLLMKNKVIEIDKKGMLSISDLKTNKLLKQYKLQEYILFQGFSNDGKNFCTTQSIKDEYFNYIYETLTGKQIFKFKKNSLISFDKFSNNGKYIISTEYNPTEKTDNFKIYDIYNKKQIFTTSFISGIYRKFNYISFLDDSNKILVRKDKNTILVDINNKEIKQFNELKGLDVFDPSFSPDLNYAYINTAQNKSFLYKTDTWSVVKEFTSTPYLFFSNNFFSNDLFYNNNNNDVVVWDIAGNKVKNRYENFTIDKISYSFDSKYIFITNGKGAFKLINANTYDEIITFYSIEDKDWVVTTTDGRFDASQAGMKELYYVKDFEIIPLENLMEGFYTPHLWKLALSGKKLEQLKIKINDIKLPPLVKITSPTKQGDLRGVTPFGTNQLKSTKKEIQITVKATDQGGGIDEILLYLNGKLIETTQRGFVKTQQINNEQTKIFTLSLANGKNIIKTTAFNKQRVESTPNEITVIYKGAAKTANLHILVIGIDNYKNSKYKLNYALADAKAFKNEIEKGSNSIFKNINITFIKDTEVTRTRILQEFKKLKTNAKQEDVFIFYYAGHGVMSDEKTPQFYIIPYDVTQLYGRTDLLKSKAISANELQIFSKELKAQKQMFIFDACQSGGMTDLLASRGAAEEKAVAQLARSTGTYWLTASGSEQFATEFKELGHGLFTYCVLLGLQGQADGGKKDKKITVKELSSFLDDKVPELSEKHKGTAQYPTLFGYGMDFPIIIVK